MMISTTTTYLRDMPEQISEYAYLLVEAASLAEEESRIDDALAAYRAIVTLDHHKTIDPVLAETLITECIDRELASGTAALLYTPLIFERLARLTELLTGLRALQISSGHGQ